MGCAKRRGEGLVSDVLQQLEGSWGEATVAVQDKGHECAAFLLGVGSVLANFVLLSRNHCFARGHVHVGGGMRVDARDVKIHSSAEHVDFAVGQKVGQVLLHDMGGTVIAAGEAAQ